MFEGVAAFLLNKYLGKYVDDLDSEQLNIGIFSGTVQLTELKLKPEALYELDLPIEVKVGCVGKISIDIPWMTLYSDPVLVHIEDIFILASPVTDRVYDAEIEKRLIRAQKRKRLEEIQEPIGIEELEGKPRGFFENLAATLVNNVQHKHKKPSRSHSHRINCYSSPVLRIEFGLVQKLVKTILAILSS